MHLYPLLPALLAIPAWLNAMLNAATFRRLPPRPAEAAPASVSICVPARNEAHRIGPLLESFLALDDRVTLELLVYDDDSTDGTAALVEHYVARDARIKLLRGNGPPAGWAGKTHGLDQLARAAAGDWLLFTDADVTLEPGGIERALAAMAQDRLDVLTLYPRQVLGTLAERICVPQMVFNFYRYAPQWLHRRGARVMIKPLNGQFNLWRRDAYEAAGGWSAVADAWLDDMAMGRHLAGTPLSVCYRPGVGVARCRMYTSFGEIWRGFAKHTFDAFGVPAPVFLTVLAYGGVVHTGLLFAPVAWALGGLAPADVAVLAAWAGLVASMRIVACLQTGGGWLGALLDPVVEGVAIANGLESYRQFRRAASRWKGRTRGATGPAAGRV